MKTYESALALGKAIRDGSTSAVEAVCASLERIKAQEEQLHAFLYLRPEEELLHEAEGVQKKIAAGTLTGPLAGVPFACKDNLCTAGMPTTCGSKMLEHYVPTYTAFALQKLKEAGAILIGKTNMDEFAFGSTTETSYFGPTRNPNDLTRVPGGSSGGSAAAVAAGEVPFALGTDTGGSVRQPAAFCGVVGMKPSYGMVSRSGLIAYASSFDQIGPLAATVSDCAAVLSVIAGMDPSDATSIGPKEVIRIPEGGALKGVRIGLLQNLGAFGVTEEMERLVQNAAERFAAQGAKVQGIDLPSCAAALGAYYTIACAQGASNLERYDGVKYGFRASSYEGMHDLYRKSRSAGFGMEVKRRILLGTYVLSAGFYEEYYLKALKVRRVLSEEVQALFETVDLILLPVTKGPAGKLGEAAGHPLSVYEGDIFTVLANLLALPAIALPAGTIEGHLPAGIQLMAPYGKDQALLTLAKAFMETEQ